MIKNMIKKYQLYSEWRNRAVYGESLTDALIRAKKLQRPDKFEGGLKTEDGEWVGIKGVAQTVDTAGSQRGGRDFESVIIEAEDGRYLPVDALEVNH
ncbi:MAG: hypothetical protein GWM98_11610 [Nitrospinaceae bacterium]|nr:hypothetical protein [Nitrospinaceae bacterium]NIR55030.1 hypothetical protein [Nitrospinaceae bacterium]NIS85429.1 hypothetical protein [Nitrospinaceae bacterium]NIT82268.1 hypothetical protein [Nitrospinaceae bacterium]NIU44498.1 hypothetical protein [Nitrospinaceae bacterium]